MDEKEMDMLLDDHARLQQAMKDPGLAVIETALFLEQTFGLELSDDDISPARLGAPEAIRLRIAERKRGR